MGGCISNKPRTRTPQQQYPPDLQSYAPDAYNSGRLAFEGCLSSIKAKYIPDSSISIKFTIPNIVELPLPKKSKQDKQPEIQWKLNEEFNFELNEYQVRTQFLYISTIDQNFNPIGQIKINLFYIITGPHHHSFGYTHKGNQLTIAFDLKISQMVQIIVNPILVSIQLNSQYPGQQFNYSFKVLVNIEGLQKNGTANHFSSEPSQTIDTPFQNKDSFRLMSHEEECPSPTKVRKTASKRIKVQTNTKLNWNEQTHKQMSKFNMTIKSLDILKCSMRHVLWRITVRENDQECVLLADNYLSFSTIFSTDHLINHNQEERLVDIKYNLQNHGKIIGAAKLKLKVINPKYYKQLQSCVRTQNGIINIMPLLKNYGFIKTITTNKSIHQITEINAKILNKNIQLSQTNSVPTIRKIKNQMLKLFKELKTTLKESLVQSLIDATQYQQKENLYQDQLKLLIICQKLCPFIQEDDIMFTQECWAIEVLILTRGQFLLRNIGIYSKECPPDTLDNKVALAVKYQQVLFKVLILALGFSESDYRKQAKQYTDLLKAVCYTRVPVYRQKLLSVLQRKQDCELMQFNRAFINHIPDSINKNNKVFTDYLDWQINFYYALKNNQASDQLLKELNQNLQNVQWFKVIEKRKDQFFVLVRTIVNRLQDLRQTSEIDSWNYFPGYNKLIECFLAEMIKTPISQYTRAFQLTSIQMLSNQKLLNQFMKILFDKTNPLDNPTVVKTLNLLYQYFEYLTKDKSTLPITFNYLSLFKAFKIIFQHNFEYTVCKALVIIYNFYDKFGVEFKKNITKYLLGKAFFDLFLNWSATVRDYFHHLMILKIQPQINQLSETMMKMSEAANMYQKSLQITQEYLTKEKENKKIAILTLDKELYKCMKKKLHFKKINKKNTHHYNVQEFDYLEISKKYLRKYSASISPQIVNPEQFAQQQSVSNDFMKQINLFGPSKTQCLAIVKQSQTHGQKISKQYPEHTTKINKKRIECFYGKDDFQLKKPNQTQLRYVELSYNRFRQIEKIVAQFLEKHKNLPIIQLKENVKIDGRDYRPQQID